jgi:hypothetical protein
MTLKKSFLFIVVSIFVFSFLYASEQSSKSSSGAGASRPAGSTGTSAASRPAGTNHVSGTLGRIRDNQIVIRVGDATKSYSFDNSTVFTSGDQQGSASVLKDGDEVIVCAEESKAVEVNGTKRIEGIVRAIDRYNEVLIIYVGQQIKRFPFNHFQVSSTEGKGASVLDMKAGDSVFINVNMGFSKTTSSKKPKVTKQ